MDKEDMDYIYNGILLNHRFFFKVISTPNVGLELTIPKSRVACSTTDRA